MSTAETSSGYHEVIPDGTTAEQWRARPLAPEERVEAKFAIVSVLVADVGVLSLQPDLGKVLIILPFVAIALGIAAILISIRGSRQPSSGPGLNLWGRAALIAVCASSATILLKVVIILVLVAVR